MKIKDERKLPVNNDVYQMDMLMSIGDTGEVLSINKGTYLVVEIGPISCYNLVNLKTGVTLFDTPATTLQELTEKVSKLGNVTLESVTYSCGNLKTPSKYQLYQVGNVIINAGDLFFVIKQGTHYSVVSLYGVCGGVLFNTLTDLADSVSEESDKLVDVTAHLYN